MINIVLIYTVMVCKAYRLSMLVSKTSIFLILLMLTTLYSTNMSLEYITHIHKNAPMLVSNTSTLLILTTSYTTNMFLSYITQS